MKLAGLPREWYDSEDFSDPKAYELIRTGNTVEIFQMASFSATTMCKGFKVSSIQDLCAVNAGNRPGPSSKGKDGLSMMDKYKINKDNNTIPSLDERIDGVLKETWGIFLYQEQIMSVARIMAGYNMTYVDKRIRKPLGKKKLEMMPEVRNEFVYGKKSIWDKEHKNVLSISQEDSPYCEGSVKRNFTEQFSNNIFDIMQEFAKYSFNKPHAFCYAVYSYKDAWAWIYFPCEYAIACIKNLNDQEKINAVIRQAKKLGVDLLPPDIRYSYSAPIMDTSNGKKDIRYGLSAIKDVGVECVNYITEVRKHYKLDSFDQFYYTMHDQNVVNTYSNKTTKSGTKTSPVTKKAEVALIKAGAFDFCEPNRYKLLNHYLIDIKKDKTHVPLDEKAYCKKYKLQYEKDTMGGYISENPLDGFPFKDLDDCKNNEVVETTCIVKSVTIKTARNKKDYATVVCEDKNGKTVKGMFFDKAYTQNAKKLKKNEILILNGTFNEQFKNINVDKCTRLIKKGDVIRLPDDDDGIVDMTTQQAPIQIQMPVINI